MPKFYA